MQMQFALPYSLAQTDFDGASTFTEMDLAAKSYMPQNWFTYLRCMRLSCIFRYANQLGIMYGFRAMAISVTVFAGIINISTSLPAKTLMEMALAPKP